MGTKRKETAKSNRDEGKGQEKIGKGHGEEKRTMLVGVKEEIYGTVAERIRDVT